MVLCSVHYFSEKLGMNCEMNVLLPQRKPPRPDGRFPVLYLLHGMSGDNNCWLRYTSIERYADGLDLAIVMPAVQMSWYVNLNCLGRYGGYFDFISGELPETVSTIFPQISNEREKRFCAGLSMGGYGALNIGLNAPDKFCAVASLSGAVDMAERDIDNLNSDGEPYWHSVFGPMESYLGTRFDLAWRAKELAASGKPAPRIYMWCGTEDFLLDQNRSMHAVLKENGYDLTYEESPGDHSWCYWDDKIKTVLRWLGYEPGK